VLALRDYQEVLIRGTREKLRAGTKRALMVAPTGAGKTVMAAFMQGGAARRGLVTWFVVHRIEILLKTAETFRAVGIDFGIVADGYPIEPGKRVQLCMVQTLVGRLHLLPHPDGIVFDEAHHIVAGYHSTIANDNPNAWQVGVTATPERLDGRGLAPFFDAMVTGPTTADLIRRGFLSPYRYYAPGKPDLAQDGGGLNRRNAAEVMGSAKLIGEAVDSWGERAEGLRTINFELSRRASLDTVEAFRTSGVSAIHVDGDMHPDARREAFAAFAAGEYKVMSNVAIAGEGVDIPGIDCVMLRDPTASLTKFLQEVGRGLRVVYGDGFDLDDEAERVAAIAAGPKAHAIVLDHAGNVFTHGMPCDERTWSLQGAKDRRRMQAANDAIPIRQCPKCFFVAPSTVRVCAGCGYEHETVYRPPEYADGELFEVKRGKADREAEKARLAAIRKAEERACKTPEDWVRLGAQRGHKPGWALHQMKIRHEYAQRFRRRA
jgi:superfamily II DNA or RNA helicase